MPSAYESARAQARALQGRLQLEKAQEIHRALLKFTDNISAEIRRYPASAQGLAATRSIVIHQADELRKQIEKSVAVGRDLSFENTLDIWGRSGRDFASARGISRTELASLRTPPITMLGAFESLSPAGTWKTLIRHNALAAANESHALIRSGLLEGVGPDELARRLRRYVVGAEPFEKVFHNVPTLSGDVAKLDLRTIPAEMRGAARRMVFNSERIAFSEMQNARAEAEIQHFIADPFIISVQWRLSPDRGTLGGPDECDYLASADFYGLGPGIYPVESVPPPPHPFDRCERDPVTRSSSELGEPKPSPSLIVDPRSKVVPFPRGGEVSPRAVERARESAANAIRAGQVLVPKGVAVEGVGESTTGSVVQAAEKRYDSLYKNFNEHPPNPKGVDSLTQYTVNGKLTPARQALHDSIVEKYLAGFAPEANPVVSLTGGSPASGKSVLTKPDSFGVRRTVTPERAVHVDVDEIRTLLPEFAKMVKLGDMEVGNFTHEEASMIAKRVLEGAVKGKFNITYDGAGDGGIESLAKKINLYRSQGARIEANYVTVDVETAKARAYARGLETGRFVPDAYLREVHANVSVDFPAAIKRGLLDKYSLWDTNSGNPVLVMTGTGKNMVIHDKAAWKRFLAKAPRSVSRPPVVSGLPLEGTKARTALTQQFKGVEATLTPAEKASYADYQLDHYIVRNRLLRTYGGDVEKMIAAEVNTAQRAEGVYIKHLRDISKANEVMAGHMNNIEPLKQPITTYRSMDNLEKDLGLKFPGQRFPQNAVEIQKGDFIVDKGFVSTTTDASRARSWVRGSERRVIFEIEVPAGSRGAWMPSVDPGSAAQVVVKNEFILPPNSKFEVVDFGWSEKYNIRQIKLRLVR